MWLQFLQGYVLLICGTTGKLMKGKELHFSCRHSLSDKIQLKVTLPDISWPLSWSLNVRCLWPSSWSWNVSVMTIIIVMKCQLTIWSWNVSRDLPSHLIIFSIIPKRFNRYCHYNCVFQGFNIRAYKYLTKFLNLFSEINNLLVYRWIYNGRFIQT